MFESLREFGLREFGQPN